MFRKSAHHLKTLKIDLIVKESSLRFIKCAECLKKLTIDSQQDPLSRKPEIAMMQVKNAFLLSRFLLYRADR